MLSKEVQIAVEKGLMLPLMEEFYTIQGEGYHTGTAAYFIRIGGCDVGCHWCDVKESWNAALHPPTSIGEIVENATKYSKTIVITGGEPISIDQTLLQLSTVPTVDPVYFESLLEPIFAQNEYFGDRWLFPYTYKSKKGENVSVKFYKSSTVESNGDIIIDVRLEKSGNPEAGAADIIHGDYVSVNMSLLRNLIVADADGGKKVTVKFRYYRADQQKELYTSNKSYSIY